MPKYCRRRNRSFRGGSGGGVMEFLGFGASKADDAQKSSDDSQSSTDDSQSSTDDAQNSSDDENKEKTAAATTPTGGRKRRRKKTNRSKLFGSLLPKLFTRKPKKGKSRRLGFSFGAKCSVKRR